MNTFYYPKLIGGAEVSVQLLAEGLKEQKHEVFVITLGAKDEVVKLNGVVIIRLKERNIFSPYSGIKRNLIQKIIWFFIDSGNPFYNSKLGKILKRIKPDIIHTNNIQGFSPHIWKTFKNMGFPVVHTMRDYYLLCHRCNMHNKLANCETLCTPCAFTHYIKKRYMDYPDVFVGISKFIVNKHRIFGDFSKMKHAKVVYNAVDMPKSTLIKAANEKVVFGFMGRIAEDKGVSYLVEQLRIVHAKFPDSFSLVLAGKGDDLYLNIIKEKLDGIICHFVGVVSPTEFYKQIDVSIVPSIWEEPFGRVAIESLAHSVPVCMSSKGGLPEIFNGECAWLFNPENDELSEILLEIIDNRELIEQKGKLSKKHVVRFNNENNITNYLRLYSQVTNKEDLLHKDNHDDMHLIV